MASTAGAPPRGARGDCLRAGQRNLSYAIAIIATIVFTSLFAVRSFYYAPPPVPASASPGVFSEARALSHALVLENVPRRWLGCAGLELAADAIEAEARRVAALAAATRPDLRATVRRMYQSGPMLLEAFHMNFGNAFVNVPNIELVLEPIVEGANEGENGAADGAARGGASPPSPAVLANAHFDASIGSPGGSDNAASVGVLLEAASVLVHNASLELPLPLVFLFNGGEETLMQGAQGWWENAGGDGEAGASPSANASAWSSRVGAFLNLESTGSLGPDVLFQSTRDWSLEAYARAAPHLRVNSVFQDAFDVGVIPADTDFRVFAKGPPGGRANAPGVDSAYVLGATVYHTREDKVARIRAGTVQAAGENFLAGAIAISRQLKARTDKAIADADAGGDAAPASSSAASSSSRFVAFDLFGRVAVIYPFWVAKVVHVLPVAALLALTTLAAVGLEPVPGAAVPPARLLACASRALLSLLLAALAPALVGAGRVALGAPPLAWYASDARAVLANAPAAVAGALAPWMLGSGAEAVGISPSDEALGASLLVGVISAALALKGYPSGYGATGYAIAAILAAAVIGRREREPSDDEDEQKAGAAAEGRDKDAQRADQTTLDDEASAAAASAAASAASRRPLSAEGLTRRSRPAPALTSSFSTPWRTPSWCEADAMMARARLRAAARLRRRAPARPTPARVALAASFFVIPAAIIAPVTFVAFGHVEQKIGLTGGSEGSAAAFAGDAIFGAFSGFLAFASLGMALPWIAFALAGDANGRAKAWLALFAVGLAGSSIVGATSGPVVYSPKDPKRLLLLHMHQIENVEGAAAAAAAAASAAAGAPPAVRVASSRLLVVGTDPSPTSWTVPARLAGPHAENLTLIPVEAALSLHPFETFLGGVVAPVEPALLAGVGAGAGEEAREAARRREAKAARDDRVRREVRLLEDTIALEADPASASSSPPSIAPPTAALGPVSAGAWAAARLRALELASPTPLQNADTVPRAPFMTVGEPRPSPRGAHLRRVDVRLDVGGTGGAWIGVNVTSAGLDAWSLSDPLPPPLRGESGGQTRAGWAARASRLTVAAGTGATDFWFDLQPGAGAIVRAHVAWIDPAKESVDIAAEFPDWCTTGLLTVFALPDAYID